jgi:hypothetical protein
MMRARRASLLLAISAVSCAAGAADPLPRDFAYGMDIDTPGEAAVYSVAIPPEVYRDSVQPSLRDVQVFNGGGQPVPFAIERPRAAAARAAGKPLPMFPLRDESPAALTALRVAIASPGSAISVQTPGSDTASTDLMSYVLDGRAMDAPVAAIQVHWSDDAADYAGRIRVEAAETLGIWRTIVAAAPLANLHADGAALLEDRVELPATRAQYWRLSWVGKPPPFRLLSAVVEAAGIADTSERDHLIAAGAASRDRPGEFEFDLHAVPPVDRLDLLLPEPNTVIDAEMLARADPKEPWHAVGKGGFYRLQSGGAELHNGPMAIEVTSDRFWLVRVPRATGALGNGIPRLEALWRPSELIFLARGARPFTLTYGSGSSSGLSTPLTSLPSAVAPMHATLQVPRTLGGESRLNAVPTTYPWRTTILWATLVIAFAALAWMALRLIQELGRSAKR